MARWLNPFLPALVALSLWSRLASAEIGAAAALFSSGREAYRNGNFELARDKFQESERLEPAVGTELNLALCDEQLGHLLSAWRLFQMALDKLSPADTRAEIARRHLEQVGRRLPQVTLVPSAQLPRESEIVIGSTRLTRSGLGTMMPMDVGPAVIVVRAPGRAPRRYSLRLDEGARTTLLLEPGTVEGPPVADGRRLFRTRPAVDRHAWGILSLGAGASLLATGAVAGYQVLNTKAALRQECDAENACSEQGVAMAHRGERLSVLSTATFVLGAGCSAVGVWLLLSEHGAQESRGKQISLGAAANGVALRGRFQ